MDANGTYLCATNQQEACGFSAFKRSTHSRASRRNTVNSGCRPRCTGGLDTIRSNVARGASPEKPSLAQIVAARRSEAKFSRAARSATASASVSVSAASEGTRRRTAAARTPEPAQ